MGADTKIEWASHTLNPWRGCRKIAPGCKFCYAEKLVNGRMQGDFSNKRIKLADAGWKEPLKWNRQAMAAYEQAQARWVADCCVGYKSYPEPELHQFRPRVFCASLADVFEEIGSDHVVDHHGRPIFRAFPEVTRPSNDPADHYRVGLDHLRRDLFALIDQTPNLDWLLLTKRPENIRRMWRGVSYANTTPDINYTATKWVNEPFPMRRNVWLGTSISDQVTADAMLPELLKCRDLAPVLFASYEPALGPVDLSPWLAVETGRAGEWRPRSKFGESPLLDWLIVGGESGHNARPFDVSWARSAIEQCKAAGVPCFVKQLGASPYEGKMGGATVQTGFREYKRILTASDDGDWLRLADKKGGDWSEWPEDLQVREFPTTPALVVPR